MFLLLCCFLSFLVSQDCVCSSSLSSLCSLSSQCGFSLWGWLWWVPFFHTHTSQDWNSVLRGFTVGLNETPFTTWVSGWDTFFPAFDSIQNQTHIPGMFLVWFMVCSTPTNFFNLLSLFRAAVLVREHNQKCIFIHYITKERKKRKVFDSSTAKGIWGEDSCSNKKMHCKNLLHKTLLWLIHTLSSNSFCENSNLRLIMLSFSHVTWTCYQNSILTPGLDTKHVSLSSHVHVHWMTRDIKCIGNCQQTSEIMAF